MDAATKNQSVQPAADDCEIDETALVGANVSVGCGVVIGPGAVVLGPGEIGDGCSIGPAALLAPDGESKTAPKLEKHVRVMAGATIVGAVRIAEGARVEPGAVVQQDVPPHAIVAGNPAGIVGYSLSQEASPGESGDSNSDFENPKECTVRGVRLHRLPKVFDLRGNLTVGEFGRTVPFEPKRYFLVFDVPNSEIRGEHAHRTCDQFLICVKGSCNVVVDDGAEREEFQLDDPAIGVYLPAMTWGIQYKYSADAVLLVFASEFYDGDEYIREYDEFLSLVSAAGS